MRKIILYIATSLDGYIAEEDGGIDWLTQFDEPSHLESYQKLISEIDVILMGYKTYHQIVNELSKNQWPYQGIPCYVLTHQSNLSQEKDIHFVNSSLDDLIKDIRQKEGKNIWLCGGASLIDQCMENDLIDEFYITTMPILLGKGIRLFNESKHYRELELISSQKTSRFVESVYHKK